MLNRDDPAADRGHMSARQGFDPDTETHRALPSFGLSAGRGPLSRRTRRVFAIALPIVLASTIAVGAVIATRPDNHPLRVVTIPALDRAATPALLEEAEAVGFEPRLEPGAGSVEGKPLGLPLPRSASGLLRVGALAPPFGLRTPTGKRVSLASLRGAPVLLEFFATWCPHCDAEAPHVERLYRSLASAGDRFLAIDADGETAPSVLAYSIYYNLGYPALLDPSPSPGSYSSPGGAGAVTGAYRVTIFPSFYVLNAAGRVVWAGEGEQPDALLKAELASAGAARG
jgi:thiol-disulfide isomerase/thioredoxin